MLQRLRRLRDAGLGDLDDAPTAKTQAVQATAFEGTEMLSLLAAFRDESRALRQTVEAASQR